MSLSTRAFLGGSALLIIALLGYTFLHLSDFLESLSMGNHCDHKVVDYNNTTTTLAQQEQQDDASPILFVHFQKSAGTTVCKIMKKQVNITDMMGNPRTAGNCNVEVSGPKESIGYYRSMQTCRLLELYTEKDRVPFTRFNFVAVEVPFHNVMPCPGFRSFALMRRPLERFVSHMRYQPNRFPKGKVVQWIDNKEAPSNFRLGYMDGYPIVNSMVIRQLLGIRRFLNMTPVDENDLENAKRQVDAFDAFVPMEYLMNEKVLQVLNHSIPEFVQGLTLSSPVHSNKNKHSNMEFDEDLLKRIAVENIYDSMLYQYVLDKFGITHNQ